VQLSAASLHHACGRVASLKILFQAEQRFPEEKERTSDPVALCSNRSDSFFGRERGAIGMVEDGVASLDF
jgi:hypothetical protein